MGVLSFRHALVTTLLLFTSASATEPDVITILLDNIWAYKMPGTRDIRELEPEQRSGVLERLSPEERRKVIQRRLWIPIALSLSADSSTHWPREGQIARPGFAIAGTGREALQGVYDILAKDEKPPDSFTFGSEITLIFFHIRCNVRCICVTPSATMMRLNYGIVLYRTASGTLRHTWR